MKAADDWHGYQAPVGPGKGERSGAAFVSIGQFQMKSRESFMPSVSIVDQLLTEP